ncbi:uncharacterized protein N7459_007694 [Penicillium hispanicum]|uniref:uncharacterized protein n=1 Tax=Penicillium hispanicum TaxID=1080232 RepID=UPI0025409F4E|nr:uncharacterized protein N7459_007694 [Penicillium hispanicum]KAJ5578730.1 hypothetical protein N7459_007694 [Penicillium hispanicum]
MSLPTISLHTPIRASITQISPHCWLLGSTVESRLVSEKPSGSYITAWKDSDGWYVISSTSEESPTTPLYPSNELPLVHEGGEESAIWAIGSNALCKVHYHWSPNIPPENETIQFVRENAPHIPVPEVLHFWVEQDRSFLILKRAQGLTLRDAWSGLSVEQQDSIVDEVASFCCDLGSLTAERLQSIQGGPMVEPYLAHSGQDLLEPLSISESEVYFYRADLDPNPTIGDCFHFYHPDLGPGNIIRIRRQQHFNRQIRIFDDYWRF